MGQQTFNNRGHDGLFHPSAIPRFTLPVSADHVVFPTLYPGGSRRTGSGKPFPLVDLAVDFIAGDLSDGGSSQCLEESAAEFFLFQSSAVSSPSTWIL